MTEPRGWEASAYATWRTIARGLLRSANDPKRTLAVVFELRNLRPGITKIEHLGDGLIRIWL